MEQLYISRCLIVAVTIVSSVFHSYAVGEDVSIFRPCSNLCRFTLTESTPVGLKYPAGSPQHISTYDAHKHLMSLATSSVHITSFYWTLRGNDISYHDESSYQGEDILENLRKLAKEKSIDLKIVQNVTNGDTDILSKDGAEVRTINFERLLHAGVLHTKMWIVDDTHMYVGSANFDWRSYTQVKELGVLIENCKCLVSDVAKIFEVYWYLGLPNATIPKSWPEVLNTDINVNNPSPVSYNETRGLVYFSSSPPPFCPKGRTNDIDAILNVINTAKEFVYISVMDYIPAFLYTAQKRFWPVIDDALRKVAYDKKIKVYLMASKWKHSNSDMFGFLKSLDSLDYMQYGKVDLQVKLFTVPSYTPSQEHIPFARVCHDKYMVTDQHAYIGTSNWSADYFVSTGGVGFILNQPKQANSMANGDLRQQLEEAFLRDWNSSYAKAV